MLGVAAARVHSTRDIFNHSFRYYNYRRVFQFCCSSDNNSNAIFAAFSGNGSSVLFSALSPFPLSSSPPALSQRHTSLKNDNNNCSLLMMEMMQKQQQQQQQQQRRYMGKNARLGSKLSRLQDRIIEKGREDAIPRRDKQKAAKAEKKKQKRKKDKMYLEEDDSNMDYSTAVEEEGEKKHRRSTNRSTQQQFEEEIVPSLPDVNQLRNEMMNIVSSFEQSLKSIRGSEPTPDMFEPIHVMAYGSRIPLSSVAQVVIHSPTLAKLTCYDPSTATSVLDAIRDAGLNLNPHVDDGDDGVVVVPIPRVSAETRRALVKQIGKMAEKTRVRIRFARKPAHETVRKGRDGKLSGISKDDAFRVEREVDALTEEVMMKLNAVVEKKQSDLIVV